MRMSQLIFNKNFRNGFGFIKTCKNSYVTSFIMAISNFLSYITPIQLHTHILLYNRVDEIIIIYDI